MSISIKGSGGGAGASGYDPSGVTATAADVLEGKTFMAKDGSMQGGSIPIKAAATITPTTSAQTISAGQYLAGDQTIAKVNLQSRSVSVSAGTSTTVKPTSGYMGLSQVTVSSPAVSTALNWTSGSFEVDTRTEYLSFNCGVSNPKVLVLLSSNGVHVNSSSYWYLIALVAYGSGLSTAKGLFAYDGEIYGPSTGNGAVWNSGSTIYIDLSEIDSDGEFDGSEIYYYYVGY